MGRPRSNPDAAPQENGPKYKTVKCITTLRPWADVYGEDETRPLKMGEVVKVSLDMAKDLVQKGFVTLWDEDMED